MKLTQCSKHSVPFVISFRQIIIIIIIIKLELGNLLNHYLCCLTV